MPVQLETGHLQLTDDEIVLYRFAAEIVAKSHLQANLDLTQPMTRMEFTMLAIAHAAAIGDDALLDELISVADSEIAKRERPH